MPKNNNREITTLGETLPRLGRASQPKPAIVSSMAELRSSIARSGSGEVMTPAEVGEKLERDRLAELSRDCIKLEADMERSGITVVPVPKLEGLEAQLAAAKAKLETHGGQQRLAKLIDSEAAEMHKHLDAKETKLDAEGYGGTGADPGSIVGLADVTPSSDTAEDGDSDRTDPHAS